MGKTLIMGKAQATAHQMAAYVLSVNPTPRLSMPVLQLAKLFLIAGEIEGVRGDLEFARSCHETGNFSFPGTVTPDQKNFCGHGTVSATEKGSCFLDEFYSVLVQVQHAKGYATAETLNYECIDSRYRYVTLGSAPHMEDMGGKWAVPGYDTDTYSSLQEAIDAEDSYGHKIVKILDKILAMPVDGVAEEKIPEAPGVTDQEGPRPLTGKKICIDAGHSGPDYNKCSAIPEYAESAVMWELGLLLKKHLEDLGAEVILTRFSRDMDKALVARGMAAAGCDMFISLHTNAVAKGMNEAVDYVAVYHLTSDAMAACDDISAEMAKVLAPAIASAMGVNQGYKILTRLADSDRNNDGVMNDNYYGVLHGARMVDVPGLILEHSFHTNTRVVRWLLNDANLDKLAKADADAIARYFAGKAEEVPFFIRVANVAADDVLYIRKEPDASAKKTGKLAYNDPNKYTIVEVRNGWGRLRSGIGWINLQYTVRA